MHIILVGLPGCGKSTVGRQLGRRLGLPFVDSDAVIEQRAGMPIRDFFEQFGEARFRDLEEAVIDELTQGPPGVLATGGGAVLRPATRERLRARGTVVYLRSHPERLIARLRRDTKRPLLQVADPLARLKELQRQRDPLYKEVAGYVIDVQSTSLSMLVNRVLMQLELQSSHSAAAGGGA